MKTKWLESEVLNQKFENKFNEEQYLKKAKLTEKDINEKYITLFRERVKSICGWKSYITKPLTNVCIKEWITISELELPENARIVKHENKKVWKKIALLDEIWDNLKKQTSKKIANNPDYSWNEKAA